MYNLLNYSRTEVFQERPKVLEYEEILDLYNKCVNKSGFDRWDKNYLGAKIRITDKGVYRVYGNLIRVNQANVAIHINDQFVHKLLDDSNNLEEWKLFSCAFVDFIKLFANEIAPGEKHFIDLEPEHLLANMHHFESVVNLLVSLGKETFLKFDDITSIILENNVNVIIEPVDEIDTILLDTAYYPEKYEADIVINSKKIDKITRKERNELRAAIDNISLTNMFEAYYCYPMESESEEDLEHNKMNPKALNVIFSTRTFTIFKSKDKYFLFDKLYMIGSLHSTIEDAITKIYKLEESYAL